MTFGETMNFEELLQTKEYDFLRTNPRLSGRIMLLGLSGSYGYGTNREGSDVDFRGVTLNLPSDLIGLTSFEQFELIAILTSLNCWAWMMTSIISGPNLVRRFLITDICSFLNVPQLLLATLPMLSCEDCRTRLRGILCPRARENNTS